MTGAAERLWQRMLYVIGRGKIMLVDDSDVAQRTQVDHGPIGPGGSLGVRDNTFRIAEFGFASHPPEGTDCVVVYVGGDRSNGVIIATNHQRYRLKGLNPGEAALYDQWGNVVHLTENGIDLTHATKITVTAPTIVLGGTVHATGDVIVTGTISGA